MPSPHEDTPAVVALRKILEADRIQLATLSSRIARQEVELAALLSASSADAPKTTGACVAFSPTKKRKHEEMDSPPAELKTDTGQSDDPIVQVMADPMLLGTSVLPFLNGTELARSAEVSTVWKRTATGPESDRLWKALALSEWPDMMKSLLDAGALDRTTFRDFYLRRKRPSVQKAPSLSEEDELFVLIDMPNLVKANKDGKIQTLHRMYPFASALRMQQPRHQILFDEPRCRCTVNGTSCAHPSAWLHFPLESETFWPNPDTMNGGSPSEEIFRLDISVLRKSDGKVVKLMQSTSSQCEVEVPDGLGDPWATYRHEYGRPLNHVAARVTAGLMAENMDRDYWYENDENVAHDEQEFALQYIVLGLEFGPEDEFSMVPISSVDKLDMSRDQWFMFLDMIRSQWA